MDLLQMENIITTQLKARVPKLTDYKYTKMSFTNEISDSVPSFPNVYVHELEPSEVGNSIPNQKIHAIRNTIQIDVSTNTNKADAKVVSNACVAAMKALRYSVIMLPVYQKINNVHRYVFRVRRVIANGDKF
jgi:hypothetical protein